MRPTSLFALFAFCAACAPAELDELTAGTDRGAQHSEIVGGTVTTGDPAVVALALGNTGEYCTGTLIAPQTVLTAAHCIYSYGTNAKYYVLFGNTDQSPTAYRQVVAQYKHPKYTGASGQGHDIGVLKLDSPVLNVTPIEANPVPLTSADVGRSIRHVGFGSTSGQGSGNGTKRQVTYNVRQVSAYEIESGAQGKQTCGGDSGGPALMVTAGSNLERVVGTISYGDPSCNQYGADSRVDVDLAWVKQTYAPWEAPSCAEDAKCVSGCTPVDQDCVCVADGVCSPDCKNLLRDPDCPKDCVQNGVCAVESCPAPDLDCVAVGGTCTSALACKSRDCLSDPQHHGTYCSTPCTQSSQCPADMECSLSKVCLFKQLPVAKLGEACGPGVWCEGTVCTGPVNEPMRCARVCGAPGDCPATESCEGGVNGIRYCRSTSLPVQPKSQMVTTRLAPAQLGPAPAGCSAAGGLPGAGLALAALALLRRRRGER